MLALFTYEIFSIGFGVSEDASYEIFSFNDSFSNGSRIVKKVSWLKLHNKLDGVIRDDGFLFYITDSVVLKSKSYSFHFLFCHRTEEYLT
jgi:hypothetical protein